MGPINRNDCLPILLLVALATGCETSDERLVEVTREANQRQAEQNRQIAYQNRQLAEASKELIEADARSRQELVALERDLQAERAVIGRRRDELESERRTIAQQRRWDSQAGDAVAGAATLLAAALPLVLCWLLLRGMWPADNADEISEVLVQELMPDAEAAPPRSIAATEDGRLPSPSHEDLDEFEEDGD